MNAIQQTLIPETETRDPDIWSPDDWETPQWLAKKMAGLLLPSDRAIWEPSAGTGNIAAEIPKGKHLICSELNHARYLVGSQRVQHGIWCNEDVLDSYCWANYENSFSVVIGNPPFSRLIEFIEVGLNSLLLHYDLARILFLLPGNFDQAKERGAAFEALDCHIAKRYKIRDRVRYLKNGVSVAGRQIDDCVFDIRPGKGGKEVYLV